MSNRGDIQTIAFSNLATSFKIYLPKTKDNKHMYTLNISFKNIPINLKLKKNKQINPC